MATFVALGKITDEGVKQLDNMASRHRQAKKRVEDAGGKVIGSYALLGPYDFAVILEFADDKAAMRFLAAEAGRGHVRYETMTAVPMDEFAKVIAG